MNYQYEKQNFPISKFFIKVIFIILIALIIGWIYYHYTIDKKDNRNNLKNNVITEQEFSKNLNEIKKVALKYFDEETVNNLKQETTKLIVKDLYNQQQVSQSSSKKNCDLTKSYIILTKKDNGFQMKIYLFCGEESDYLEFFLIPNGNCNTYLCDSDDSIDEDETKMDLTVDNQNEDRIFNADTKSSQKNKINSSVVKKTIKKKVRKTPTNTKGLIEVSDTTNDRYLYQYVKTVDLHYSQWSNWQNSGEVACESRYSLCNNTSICLKEEKVDQIKNFINKKYIANKIAISKNGSVIFNVCIDGNYIAFNGTIYQTASDYQNINNWIYEGRYKYNTPPKDSLNTKYNYVNIDYSNCKDTCNGQEVYYFDKYTYNNISIASTNCNNKITKSIDTYAYISSQIINYRNELDKIKCYKMIRTRNLIGTPNYVWAEYNNQYLLKNGYQYTGKKEYRKGVN